MEDIKDIALKDLHQIDRMTKVYMRHNLRKSGLLDIGHPYILKVLIEPENNGQVDTQKDFAEVLKISPAAIAQSIKRMKQEGLVDKVSDESDLRVNQITITPKGREFVRKMDEGLHLMSGLLFTDFTDEEVQEYHQYSQRVLENLKKIESNVECFKEIIP
jgi:DNA-binding MarR family transcriptional regulator